MHWISHCSYFCNTVITLFIFLKKLLLTLLIFLQYCNHIVHISTLDTILTLFIFLHWILYSHCSYFYTGYCTHIVHISTLDIVLTMFIFLQYRYFTHIVHISTVDTLLTLFILFLLWILFSHCSYFCTGYYSHCSYLCTGFRNRCMVYILYAMICAKKQDQK